MRVHVDYVINKMEGDAQASMDHIIIVLASSSVRRRYGDEARIVYSNDARLTDSRCVNADICVCVGGGGGLNVVRNSVGACVGARGVFVRVRMLMWPVSNNLSNYCHNCSIHFPLPHILYSYH